MGRKIQAPTVLARWKVSLEERGNAKTWPELAALVGIEQETQHGCGHPTNGHGYTRKIACGEVRPGPKTTRAIASAIQVSGVPFSEVLPDWFAFEGAAPPAVGDVEAALIGRIHGDPVPRFKIPTPAGTGGAGSPTERDREA